MYVKFSSILLIPILFLLSAVTCNCAVSYIPEDISKQVEIGRSATFSLWKMSEISINENAPARGNCVVIKSDPGKQLICATARHTAENLGFVNDEGVAVPTPIVAMLEYKGEMIGTFLLPDKKSDIEDIAILKSITLWDGPNIAVRIHKKLLPIGYPIYIVGSPVSMSGTVSYGYIANKVECKGSVGLCYVAGPMTFGNSGGGLFNYRGELIGIASAVSIMTTPVIVERKDVIVKITNSDDEQLVIQYPIVNQGFFIPSIQLLKLLE